MNKNTIISSASKAYSVHQHSGVKTKYYLSKTVYLFIYFLWMCYLLLAKLNKKRFKPEAMIFD